MTMMSTDPVDRFLDSTDLETAALEWASEHDQEGINELAQHLAPLRDPMTHPLWEWLVDEFQGTDDWDAALQQFIEDERREGSPMRQLHLMEDWG